MKIHKVSLIIMGILSLVSAILALWFSSFQNQLYYNIMLAIFGSSLTLCIHSIVMYTYNYEEITRLFREEAQILQNFIETIYKFDNQLLNFEGVVKFWSVTSSSLNSLRKLQSLSMRIDYFNATNNQRIEKYFLSLQSFEQAIKSLEPELLIICSGASFEGKGGVEEGIQKLIEEVINEDNKKNRDESFDNLKNL